MNLKSRAFSLTVALLTTLVSLQATAAVTLIDEERRISVDARATGESSFQARSDRLSSAGDFAPFDETLAALATADLSIASATAQQFSSISASSFVAQGFASASAHGLSDEADADASSRYEVTFEIADDMLFSMHGSVRYTEESGNPSGSSFVELQRTGFFSGGGFLIRITAGDTVPAQPFNLSGLLVPGQYTLIASTSVDATSFGSTDLEAANGAFDVNLRLTGVPLPPAMWLMGAAMLSLGGFARRRRSR